jgi:hypothetical protein
MHFVIYKYEIKMLSIKNDLPMYWWSYLLRVECEYTIEDMEFCATNDDVFIAMDCFSDLCEKIGLPGFKSGMH